MLTLKGLSQTLGYSKSSFAKYRRIAVLTSLHEIPELIVTSSKQRASRFTQRTGIVYQEMSKFEAEKQKYLSMSLEDRRALYKKNVTRLSDIPTWLETWEKNNSKNPTEPQDNKKSGEKLLASKVSTWAGNITLLEVDAIVNAANRSLLGGGGVDGAIHEAAGSMLREECRTLAPCGVGEVKITGGYRLLPVKYIVHTVGPQGEKPEKLKECYENSLKIAKENGLRSVAFPCISTGVYGYPHRPAAEVALETVKKYLEVNGDAIDRVVFCLFLETDQQIYEELIEKFFPLA